MAKSGLNLKDIFQIVESECDWALCIGAGCSLPIFPSWNELSVLLAKRYSLTLPTNQYAQYFTPDVYIQSIYERVGRPDDFADVLSSVLYAHMFDNLSVEETSLVVKCLSNETANGRLWGQYVDIIKRKGVTTAVSLAEFIADSVFAKNRPPRSIISFNAELLLPSLINAFSNVKFKHSAKILDYVTEPISNQYQGRIPFVFCHGVVPVPGSGRVAQKKFNAKDKLVFSENEYSQLANSSFSWQSASFMSTLMNSKVFFIGLSLTDPNIRRWLAWLHKSRFEAIRRIDAKANESTSHYWIEKSPMDEVDKAWLEASVAHLGLRIIWVDEYSDVVEVLKKAIK